ELLRPLERRPLLVLVRVVAGEIGIAPRGPRRFVSALCTERRTQNDDADERQESIPHHRPPVLTSYFLLLTSQRCPPTSPPAWQRSACCACRSCLRGTRTRTAAGWRRASTGSSPTSTASSTCVGPRASPTRAPCRRRRA